MTGAAWDTRRPPGHVYRWPLYATVLTLGCAATIAATIAGNGNVAVALAPTLVIVALATIWLVPSRLTLLALTFLVLALDAPGDAAAGWQSPFGWIGLLLTYNLNKTIPLNALAIPLTALVILYVLVIYVHRRLSGSRVDDRGNVAIAAPMLWGLGISGLSVFALCLEGYLKNGNTQMAKNQVQTFLLLLLMAYLLLKTFRGERDYRALGRVIVAAACTKALMALWVWYTIEEKLAFRTSHGDSILFASAAITLVVLLIEQPIKRNVQLCVVFLPLIFAGMVANNRRTVWVQLVAALLTLTLLSRRTRLTVAITRAALLAVPIVAVYAAVGWNSGSQLFAPVKMLRSVADADVDRSTLYRDIEDYNLVATLKQNPIMGTGFGQPYVEAVTHDDLSFFKEYLYLPHNSILGLWASGGLIGFTGISAALVVGIFLAARRYFQAASAVERAAAFSAIATIVIYLIQCWADIGFSEKRTTFLVGAALAVAGQLSPASGLWRGRSSHRARSLAPRT